MASLIVIIDDQQEMRTLARAALEKAGFLVEDFESASKGLARMLSKPRPALILLDAVMPEMDGFGFLAAIAAKPEAARIPIVFCSSLVDLERSKTPASVNIVARLDKPFTGAQLVKAIRDALAQAVASRF